MTFTSSTHRAPLAVKEWAQITDALQTAADAVFANPGITSELDQVESVRYLLRFLSSSVLMEIEERDPAYPELVCPWTAHMGAGFTSPDAKTQFAAVHGDYTYRITGDRGSAHVFDVETDEFDFSQMPLWRQVGSRRDFEVGTDGRVEITLSRHEQPGNWVRLPDGWGHVLLREFFYDWDNEIPAKVRIERVGAVLPPPPPSVAEFQRKFALLADILRDSAPRYAKQTEVYFRADPGTVPFPPMTFGVGRQNGMAQQTYGQGHYRCGPDEAVIMETEMPVCQYWSFHLLGMHFEIPDWILRQISLNGHQAVVDDDDKFRAVIAHRDPGVPNWLDAGGHEVGLISGRYNNFETVPIPTLRTVPFDELRAHLPASTRTVTPTERSESLARRMLAMHRRFA